MIHPAALRQQYDEICRAENSKDEIITVRSSATRKCGYLREGGEAEWLTVRAEPFRVH
jgi:hypothetical protein